MAECAACLTRPAPDATICPGCTAQAAGYLRQIPWLTEQLTITLTRQARIGDRNGPRSRETPLVYDPRASVDLETFHVDLGRWATTVAEHRGVQVDEPATPAGLSRWLLRWNGAAAQHPDAGDYVDELAAMVRAAERTIDKAPDLRCLGPCDMPDCEAWLYVGMYADTVACPNPDCDAEYRVEERRAWLLEQTVDRLMTAAEIARDLPWIAGVKIDRKLINKWSSRDQIHRYDPHHADRRGAPRFRVGEVVDRIRADASEKTLRGSSGAA